MTTVLWSLEPAPAAELVRSIIERELAGVHAVLLPHESSGGPDALLVAAAAAARTTRIGLIAALSPWSQPPFHTARALTALDALSRGRAGWAVSSEPPAAVSADDSGRWWFADATLDELAPALVDYVSAAEALWNSWDDGALIADVASGRYVDASRVHVADYRGPFFRTRGPLNSPPSPQRIPPRFAAAADAAAAPVADVLLVDDEAAVAPARALGADHVLLRLRGRAAVEPPPTSADGYVICGVAGGSRFGHIVHETVPSVIDVRRAATLRSAL